MFWDLASGWFSFAGFAKILVALFVVIWIRHLRLVWSLPPGPFPLPLIGNILGFLRGGGGSPMTMIEDYCKKYKKGLFTVWLGTKPSVFIYSWDMWKEALITKKSDFSGRTIRRSLQLICEGHGGIAFSDVGPQWRALKNAFTVGLRQLVQDDTFSEFACKLLDSAVETFAKEDKPVNSGEFNQFLVYNLLTKTAFGCSFGVNDEDYQEFFRLRKIGLENFSEGLPGDVMPFLSCICKAREQKLRECMTGVKRPHRERFRIQKSTYKPGVVRDIADVMMAARDAGAKEDKESAHFKDEDIIAVLRDVSAVGFDTTFCVLLWLILVISKDQDLQEKMREEIDGNIGGRIPSGNDRSSCHLTSSVIAEVLRFGGGLVGTPEYRTTCNTKLGGYDIPKDTSVFFLLSYPHRDPSYWSEPEKFQPERFLQQGKFISTKLPGYLPFSIGQRSCAGEKLALTAVFLFISRLLQKYSLELEHGPDSVSLERDIRVLYPFPQSYKFKVKPRK